MSEHVIYFSDEDLKNEEQKEFDKESIYSKKFSDIKGLNDKLISQLSFLGYEKLTKVQEIVIPKILGGGDILLRAPTGTGKTLSFLVPAIQNSLLNRIGEVSMQRSDGTIILILTPTRELCIQTIETARRIVQKISWCVVGCICGGEKRKSEKARLRKGVTILGGTPGRILDHIDSTNCFKVINLKTLIVDEADRLLEEGFNASYKKIYQFVTKKNGNFVQRNLSCEIGNKDDHDFSMMLNVKTSTNGNFDQMNLQVILVSATLSKPVEDLANYSLKNSPEWLILDQYQRIEYKRSNSKLETQKLSEHATNKGVSGKGLFTVPITLRQEYVVIQDKFRIPALISLLLSRTEKGKRTVLFVSSTQVVEFYFALLQSLRWPSKLLIRGGPSIKNSIKVLEEYKREIYNKNFGGYRVKSSTKGNKRRLYQNNRTRSDSESDFDNEITDSDSDKINFNSRINGKRPENIHKGHKKWFTNSSQLVEIFESMFEEYIFKNPFFDDEIDQLDYKVSDYDGKLLGDGEVVSIKDLITRPPIFMLHGHMNKDDRIGQLTSFEKNSWGGVLITSDVASRGLNFPRIDTVVQLDPPQSIEEYVHRMGRTARMGDKGTGILFLRPSEEDYLDILNSYNITSQGGIIKLSDTTVWEGLLSNSYTGKIDDISGFFYSIINKIITLDPKDSYNELLNKARRAYIAYIRSYMSYDREFSKIFSIKKLHLGHVASSFGINEQPNEIVGHVKYLDGIISYRENLNANKASRANVKKPDLKKPKYSRVDQGETSKAIATMKRTPKKRRNSLEGTLREQSNKADPNKSGIINQALRLMKSRNEIYAE
ncbi:DEAD/DEAH box helicase family protein [Cryptosporidium felis]|nr:DEAD/DEAH box helicase family protein [Cryptosporidium felis]